MSPTVDAAREWMDEGDHLLACAYEYLAASTTDPAQAAMATEYFSRAAQTYLGGAVVHQSGVTSVVSPLPDIHQLTSQLTGRLRAEVLAAERDSTALRVTGATNGQAFAEALRERFSTALPEIFGQPSNEIAERLPSSSRSR